MAGRFVVPVALALLVAGCARATPAGGSGIEGRVLRGPQCPVVAEGSPCPDEPVSASVSVRTPGGEEVATFRSGEDGRFRVALDPGRYVLVADVAGVGMFAKPVDVTVRDGRYAVVDVLIDTGVR